MWTPKFYNIGPRWSGEPIKPKLMDINDDFNVLQPLTMS